MTDYRPSRAELQRYLAGESSVEEAARVEKWMASSRGQPDWDADAALVRIKRHAVARLIRSSPAKPRWPSGIARTAALLAAALLLVVTWRVGVSRHGASPVEHPMRRFTAAAGERLQVTLPDGSRLTLAPASALDVPADYANGHRVVALTGEALFTVVHDERHPFVVRTASGETRDVGTTFDVREYSKGYGRVAVVEGEVAVRAVAVHAGELAMFCDTILTVARDAHIDRYVAWATGHLVFHATPLDEVARDLSRWYDLDVQVTDSTLGRRLFSGSYTTESPNAVLSLISAATHARFARRGRLVTISPRY
jgi:transmembrane sensor